jgi:hypothetical protein
MEILDQNSISPSLTEIENKKNVKNSSEYVAALQIIKHSAKS